MILVGTKCDLRYNDNYWKKLGYKNYVETAWGEILAEKIGAVRYIEVSKVLLFYIYYDFFK
jgi:hypothetical protein